MLVLLALGLHQRLLLALLRLEELLLHLPLQLALLLQLLPLLLLQLWQTKTRGPLEHICMAVDRVSGPALNLHPPGAGR